LSDLIAGKTIPNADKRLTDRADITGDTYINNDDLTIVQKFVNGQSNYLPNQINKSTRAEGVAWIRKMMTINNLNVDEIVSKGGDCNEFARQLVINFNTLSSEELSKLTASFPYDLSNAGRFKNINMRAAAQFFYKSGEDSANLGIIPYAGHQMNVVLLGNDARDIKNLCFVDGQSHTVIDAANNVWLPGIVDVNFGQGYLDGRNTLLDIRGSPVSSGGIMAPYVLWKVVDNVPTKLDWESDVVKFVSSR
jgi:hypothetical protein